jgi:HD-GYP domain-containing protein (c-di-GMP phosphodiesterase class II)
VTTAATSVAEVSSGALVAEARARYAATRVERRAARAFLFSGSATLAGAIACAWVLGVGTWADLGRALAFLAVYALLARVQFEIGAGSAVPTELILVPMLFALPLGLVPLLVAVGFLIAYFVDRPRTLLQPRRALPAIASAAHAFGPVIVIAAAHGLPLRWSAWPIYVGALGAQLAFDAAAGTIANAAHDIELRKSLPVLAWAYSVDLALAPRGLAIAFAARDRWWVIALALPLVLLLRAFAGERARHLDSAIELGNAYRGTTYLLGDVIDADDEYTGRHSRHVVELVVDVAKKLRLGIDDLRNAEFAALLHDVGKIKIPKRILNKPGPLTPEERAVMETHAVEGERLLTQVGGLLDEVGHVVRSCHERWDGSGYPDGLAGDQIPLVSRIVAACDAYSAMTTDRPYRPAMPDSEARAELARCSGAQFDPKVVAALMDVLTVSG